MGLGLAGLASLVVGAAFGTPALAFLGGGLLAIPVLALLVAGAAALATRPRRTLPAGELRAGLPIAARIDLGRGGALRALADVAVDPGTAPALRDGAARRGRWVLERPRAIVSDPLGLARLGRDGAPEGEVVRVLPRPLPVAPSVIGGGTGGARARREGFGELDRVRDYRDGDPLSRIHWPQTARRGRLQTKELRGDAGDAARALLVLQGAGHPDPDDAFEDAVAAAAGLGRVLLERGHRLGLVRPGAAEVVVEDVGSLDVALSEARSSAPDGPPPPPGQAARLVALVSASAAAPAAARALGGPQIAILVGPAATAAPALREAGAAVVAAAGGPELARALAVG